MNIFRAIVKFCSTNRLFTYFRRRMSICKNDGHSAKYAITIINTRNYVDVESAFGNTIIKAQLNMINIRGTWRAESNCKKQVTSHWGLCHRHDILKKPNQGRCWEMRVLYKNVNNWFFATLQLLSFILIFYA